MTDALNMLYRLFAPLFVVVLIIVGVDLSSGLIKNTKEKQTAITIAHAATCPTGAITAVPPCTARDAKGNILQVSCYAPITKNLVQPGVCFGWSGIGCCKALGSPTALSVMQKSSFGSTIKGALGSLTNSFTKALPIFLLSKMMQSDSDDPPQVQSDYDTPPQCKSVSVTPTLPLREGESAVLTWRLGGDKAESIIVSPGVGLVSGFSVRVSPDISTTYTVIARNRSGSTECPKVRVYVGPRDLNNDGVINETDATYNNDDANIWNDGGVDNSGAQGEPYSPYDDAGQTPAGGDGYYEFLNSLSDTDKTVEPTAPVSDTAEYYYGGSEVTYPDNNTFDDTYYDYTEDNGEYYYDTGNAQVPAVEDNASGLTNQEIYGIWSRPQSPVTGGLGLTGGSVTGSLPEVDLSTDESDESLFARIGGWFKSVFCFWCDGGTVSFWQVDGGEQAALTITRPLSDSIRELTQKPMENLVKSFSKQIVCKDEGGDKALKIKADIGMLAVVKYILVDIKLKQGAEFFTSRMLLANTEPKIEVGKCTRLTTGEYSFELNYSAKFRGRDKNFTTIGSQKIRCTIPKVAIVDTTFSNNWIKGQPVVATIKFKDEIENTNKSTEEISTRNSKQFSIICGDHKQKSSLADGIKKIGSKIQPIDNSKQLPILDRVLQQAPGKSFNNASQPKPRAQANLSPANTLGGKGAIVSGPSASTRAPAKAYKPQSSSMWQKMFWMKMFQNMNKPKQQAQKRRPATSNPRQVDRPQCYSITSDKREISSGEEITLTWSVTGASRIIISPKVTVVDEGGRKVAKARPESSVAYTLIAYNTKGDEHSCKTPKILVDEEGPGTCDGKVGTVDITIDPNSVTRPLCDPNKGAEECNDEWEGKPVTIDWQLSCVDSCVLEGPDGLRKSGITSSSDLTGKLRKTSTFRLVCKDKVGNNIEDSATATVQQVR